MSDDYIFDDEITLDEDALAILDATESNYFGMLENVQTFPQPAKTHLTPPPAKRRRTDDDGGWDHPSIGIPGGSGKLISQKRSDSFYEDLPNISLAGDGVYGVSSQGSQTLASSAKSVANPLGQRSRPTALQQPTPVPAPAPIPAPALRERTSSANQNRPPPRPAPQRTHTPPSNVPYNPNNSNRPQPQQQYRQQQPTHVQQQHPNQAVGQIPKSGSVPPQQNRPQNLGPGRNVNVPRQQPRQDARQFTPVPIQPTDKDLQEEVARLRAQLELMNNQQESMQKAFREEQDARFQNQGEVTILRKKMEKLTEEHNTNVKRLKTAKEVAEAAQAQIQKDTREEIERIKTQFTFKQHEIEASLRKPSYSAKNRNKSASSNGMRDRLFGGSSEFPSTPWGKTPVPNHTTKTPSKSRIGDFLSPGPVFGPNSPRRSQPRPISQMALPGFKNAFEVSPKKSPGKGVTKHMPVPFPPSSSANGRVEAEGEWGSGVNGDGSPGGRKWKGKEKAIEPIEEDIVPMMVSPVKSPFPKLTQGQPPATPRSVGTQLGVGSSPLVSQFGDGGELGLTDLEGREDGDSDVDEFVPLSLAGELHHRIFTHLRPSTSKTTIQLLMALELSEGASQDDRLTFKASTMELWNVLNGLASFDIVSIDQQYRRVAYSLTKIAYVVNKLKLLYVLSAVFSLLGTLVFFVPRFCGALLSEEDNGIDSSPTATTNVRANLVTITSVLRDAIRTYFTHPRSTKPPKELVRVMPEAMDEKEADLGREVLGFLEALCWGAPDNLESRLADVVSAEGVLDTLVDPRQPSWFLYGALRALALFTSRKELYKRFLSIPGSNLTPSQGGDLDMATDPDIEVVQDIKLPHLECLCLHLGDHTRNTEDAESARNGIVTVIATLAVAHQEARAVLLSSDTLASALISRMHHLTSLLWEDDPRTISSDELVNTTSRALSRTLFVFHYLLFANHPQAPFDLKRKIRAAPPSAAIDHMFNVTFGRLSFAPDLKNVPEEAERVLGRIVNSTMASDILQLVVDMPEDEDLIWQAYQDEEPSDDEEEARMMEANEV